MSYTHRGNRPKGRPFEASKLHILLGQIEVAKTHLAQGETRWLWCDIRPVKWDKEQDNYVEVAEDSPDIDAWAVYLNNRVHIADCQYKWVAKALVQALDKETDGATN